MGVEQNSVPRDFENNPRNAACVSAIKKALSHYASRDENDIRATLTDFLCDVMILCRSEPDDEGSPMEFDELCRVAEAHCEAFFAIDALEADTLVLEGHCHYEDDRLVRDATDKPE